MEENTPSESGTPVADAIFNDSTPIEETFEDEQDTHAPQEDEETVTEHESDDTEETTVEEDDDDTIKPASFDDLEAANKHIAKQNRENAAKRVALKEYSSVFDKFDDEAKPLLLGLVSQLADDPEAGAKQLLQVAKNILGEDALKEQEIDPDKPMTRKEYEDLKKADALKVESERKQQTEREENEKAVKAILSKADELGYKEKTVERSTLMAIAAASTEYGGTNGNLEEAHKAFQGMIQKHIQAYIDGKSNQADDFPITAEGAQPAAKGAQLKDWNDFIDQATAQANAQLGQ